MGTPNNNRGGLLLRADMPPRASCYVSLLRVGEHAVDDGREPARAQIEREAVPVTVTRSTSSRTMRAYSAANSADQRSWN